MKTCERCLRPDVCNYAGQCLKPEEKPAPKADDVIEMGLCEVPHISLRPDQLYRFVVMPGCAKCESAAAPYLTNS
jgi:hypothetical protein